MLAGFAGAIAFAIYLNGYRHAREQTNPPPGTLEILRPGQQPSPSSTSQWANGKNDGVAHQEKSGFDTTDGPRRGSSTEESATAEGELQDVSRFAEKG